MELWLEVCQLMHSAYIVANIFGYLNSSISEGNRDCYYCDY